MNPTMIMDLKVKKEKEPTVLITTGQFERSSFYDIKQPKSRLRSICKY